MSGADLRARCDQLRALFARAPIRASFGMELSFDDQGRAVLAYAHNASLEHALGDTHGGIIATLLDNAGWFTAAARYSTWIATADLHIRLLEPAGREDLRATGRLVRAGARLAVADMEVRSASDRLVAIGSASFSVTDRPA